MSDTGKRVVLGVFVDAPGDDVVVLSRDDYDAMRDMARQYYTEAEFSSDRVAYEKQFDERFPEL